jgi:hypothetical protein
MLAGAALVALAFVTACRGEAEQSARSEAGLVARAIEQLRASPREQRGPLIAALARIPCRSDAACRVQKTCVDAYSLERSALEVVRTVSSAGSEEPVTPGAGELLLLAERDLGKARDLAHACADEEGELRRRYSLR